MSSPRRLPVGGGGGTRVLAAAPCPAGDEDDEYADQGASQIGEPVGRAGLPAGDEALEVLSEETMHR